MDFYDTTHFMLDPIFEIGSLINVKDKEGIYIIENILADSNEDPPTVCYSLFQKSPGGKFIPRQKQERDIVYKCNLIKSLSHPSRYDSLKVGDIIYHAGYIYIITRFKGIHIPNMKVCIYGRRLHNDFTMPEKDKDLEVHSFPGIKVEEFEEYEQKHFQYMEEQMENYNNFLKAVGKVPATVEFDPEGRLIL